MAQVQSIPRPLVRVNQWTILLSVLLTWITGQVWILLIPLIANLSGVLFNFNPIIKMARVFIIKEGKSYIPEDVVQQKFNACIALFCLSGGFISLSIGWALVGFVFTILVAVASFIAILGFCIGCFIFFQFKQYQYRRTLKQT
ncbi:DUF4395 domain-containing protein [Ureibacillus manganicus]|uniref:DUF4395 domain-containing protein n=1 Tax=Ureibacillus manganicus DSM 26584 TaxID=1384049 RepID=A0A0A3I3I5_9BACL|nr:DUF4395 domain-containing protein [Ureibacillus manganicus]KGR79346.1 hypothetical protein CD29_06525 [Ureibacillus manganicus DSM 26584]